MGILVPQYGPRDENYDFLKNPFSPNLYTFFVGVILLKDQLLSIAEENK
jgi:hypothetical protein